MLSITVSGPSAAALAGHLSGNRPKPGPSPQAFHAPGRIALPPPQQPRSSADGGNAVAMFDTMLARRDADGDGQLSVAETSEGRFSGLISKVFGTIDADADGLLSQTEMTAAAGMIADGTNLFMLAKAGAAAAQSSSAVIPAAADPPPEVSTPALSETPPDAAQTVSTVSQTEALILAMVHEDEALQALS